MMGKAQTSMEYMTIVLFITVTLIPLVLLYHSQYEGTNEQIRSNQADQIARKIVDTAESVYYLGENSKTSIKVYMPTGVENITVSGREIVFTVRTRYGPDEVVRVSNVDITGSIPSEMGIKTITVESKGSYVEITGS